VGAAIIMRGILTADFLLSLIISTLTLVLLFSSFYLLMGSITSQLSIAEKERRAILLADQLLFGCEDKFGLALCENGRVEKNVLSDFAVAKFTYYDMGDLKKYYRIENSTKLSISIRTVGKVLLLEKTDLEEKSQKICIKRLAMMGLENKVVFLVVCVW
jgi:hypothetical protein